MAAKKPSAIPIVISFTVETNGSLSSGESLLDAVEAVDAATQNYVSFLMINCAHPSHFASVFSTRGRELAVWRIGGLRHQCLGLGVVVVVVSRGEIGEVY